MVGKFLARAAVAGGVVAGAAYLIRKHDLVARGAAVAEDLIEKLATGAESLVAKGVGVTDDLLTRFANDPTPTTDAGPTDDAWARATRDGAA